MTNQTEAGKGQRLIEFYKQMLLIRRFEEQAIELYKEGLIGGSYHPYIGQEAVAVGVCQALQPDDYMTNTYRGRGQHLAKGADPKKLYAEILGKATGYCKGKGGPMHIADLEHGILGANGIVGGGIPIAVGAALTAKMSGTNRIAVTFFGDGAINQGAFYEAANLAAVWNLPVLFICENNMYSEMTPIKDAARNSHLSERAAAFAIPGITVDGNDVEAVYEAAAEAAARARRGEGPALIEADTYRLSGHMYGDSESYRTRQEVDQWWQKEPLLRLKEKIIAKGLATGEAIRQWDEQIQFRIKEAVEFSRSSPEPDLDELFTDVV